MIQSWTTCDELTAERAELGVGDQVPDRCVRPGRAGVEVAASVAVELDGDVVGGGRVPVDERHRERAVMQGLDLQAGKA
eukprot:SAG22_NODE_122_length_18920_cov_23.494076_5_plen_79_part_00